MKRQVAQVDPRTGRTVIVYVDRGPVRPARRQLNPIARSGVLGSAQAETGGKVRRYGAA